MSDRPPDHQRPDRATDGEVEAAGKMSEALETLHRARGHLYSMHQLIGEGDLALDGVLQLLRGEGHADLAARMEQELLGRNVIPGRWTFQVVEEFDDGYFATFSAYEREVRDALMDGRRHVFEAEMKEERRTDGRPEHRSRPG